MCEGLSTGFTKSLNLIGVGYRATLGAKELTLNLGYSLPVVMQIPEGIEVQVWFHVTNKSQSCDCSVMQDQLVSMIRDYGVMQRIEGQTEPSVCWPW